MIISIYIYIIFCINSCLISFEKTKQEKFIEAAPKMSQKWKRAKRGSVLKNQAGICVCCKADTG